MDKNFSHFSPWNPEITNAHRISWLVFLALFGLVSLILGSLSVINGWKRLNDTEVRQNSTKIYKISNEIIFRAIGRLQSRN